MIMKIPQNISFTGAMSLAIMVLFASCFEIDNYDEPNGAIYGELIDGVTSENFQSEQPNGFSIKLFEKGGEMNSPITFWGRPDGTFENAWVFQNEYKVVPTEGAFFPVDTVVVQVGSQTEVNFMVTPFLAVTNVSVQPAAGKITASYQIARTVAADKIIERKLLVSEIPTVNNVVFDFKNETDLSGIPDETILATPFTDEITGLSPGKYYVRVAVSTDNALKKYNYSNVFEVTVP
jgi:hypothetical protein